MSLVSSLAAVNGLMRLRGDELPEPALVSVYRVGDYISVQLETEDDLRAWAKHFHVEVIRFARCILAEVTWGAASIHLYVRETRIPEQRVDQSEQDSAGAIS